MAKKRKPERGLLERIAPRNRRIGKALSGLRGKAWTAKVKALAARYGLSPSRVRCIAREGEARPPADAPDQGEAIRRRLEVLGPIPGHLRGLVYRALAQEFGVGAETILQHALALPDPELRPPAPWPHGRKPKTTAERNARALAIRAHLELIGPVPFGRRGRVVKAVAERFGVDPVTVWRHAPDCWKGPNRWAGRKTRAREGRGEAGVQNHTPEQNCSSASHDAIGARAPVEDRPPTGERSPGGSTDSGESVEPGGATAAHAAVGSTVTTVTVRAATPARKRRRKR